VSSSTLGSSIVKTEDELFKVITGVGVYKNLRAQSSLGVFGKILLSEVFFHHFRDQGL
jgi:hypothetical protein